MPSLTDSLVLKVFSGPHVGAEILLKDGEYVLGSGEDCDVILHDQLIADQHVRLSVHDGRIVCTPLEDAKVIIAGQAVGERAIEPFEFFTIGNTHLAIGPGDQPWPHRDFPDYQLNQPAANDESGLPDDLEGDFATADDEIGTDTTLDAASNEPDHPADSKAPLTRTRKIQVVLVNVAMLIVVMFGSWMLLGALKPVDPTAQMPLTVTEIREIIKKLAPNSDLHVSERDEKLVVDGYVENADTERGLRKALLDRDRNLDLKIIDTMKLVDGVKSSLRMHHVTLEVAAGKPGEVIVSGEIQDLEQWNSAKSAVWGDVPRIKALNDRNVHTPPLPVADTDPPVSENTVAEALPVMPRLNTVVSARNAAPRDASDPQPIAISDIPDLRVDRVVLGQQKLVVLDGGVQLYEGGSLKNGYVLKTVSRDRLILSRNEEEYSINLSQVYDHE